MKDFSDSKISPSFIFFRSLFSRFIEFCVKENRYPLTLKYFRVSIFLWAILNISMSLPYHQEIWGAKVPHEVDSFQPQGYLDWAKGFILHPEFRPFYLVLCYSLFVTNILGALGFFPRFCAVYYVIVSANLDALAPSLGDGGTNLASLLIFYLIFADTNASGKKIDNLNIRYVSNAFSNASFLLMRIQVCIVYLAAGLYKATGDLWQKGTSLFYILQVDEFSTPLSRDLILSHPWLSVLGSYFTIVFQISFVFLAWRKTTAPFLVLLGVFFHLGIWLGMGLFTFALVMCVSYILFVDESDYRRLKQFFSGNSQLHVAFDSRCSLCMKFARFLKAFDFLDLIVIDDARNPSFFALRSVDVSIRTKSIVSVETQANVFFFGFSTIERVFRKIPFAFPIWPLLYFCRVTGLGDFLYSKIADSSVRKSCGAGACDVV
jgi:predicted DCC family thiol-disulfide oxidoreductase YuxK